MTIFSHVVLTLKWAVRDRLAYAVLGVALLLLLGVPLLSSFSMRQVQELAITLTLSFNAFFVLALSLLMGSASLWRDIEKRYIHTVLTLPAARARYLAGKFLGLAVFLFVCSLVLGIIAAAVVALSSARYPSDVPIAWGNFFAACLFDCLKSILVAAFAILFSTVATSFYLPFFATAGVYLAGSAMQEVYEYIHGSAGEKMAAFLVACVDFFYYLLPNLAAFDFKVQATYALPVQMTDIGYGLGYFVLYLGLVLGLAIYLFQRRQFS